MIIRALAALAATLAFAGCASGPDAEQAEATPTVSPEDQAQHEWKRMQSEYTFRDCPDEYGPAFTACAGLNNVTMESLDTDMTDSVPQSKLKVDALKAVRRFIEDYDEYQDLMCGGMPADMSSKISCAVKPTTMSMQIMTVEALLRTGAGLPKQ